MSELVWRIYFDASALVKRYAPEDGAALVDELFRLVPAARMHCLLLGLLEVISILIRKRNDGRLDVTRFDRALLNLNAEVIGVTDFSLISPTDAQMHAAITLLHTHNLNATDTVVLRTAIDLRAVCQQSGEDLMLWAADQRLARAAKAEGLAVCNPEKETVDTLRQLLGVSQSSPEEQ